VLSVYHLADLASSSGQPLRLLVEKSISNETVDYDQVYSGASPWRLLPPIDHPEPARCLISGTGLTHRGSAGDRQAMHVRQEMELTDSMRMFRLGVEGGRPAAGQVGAAPEWFYKGCGTALRAHGEPLVVPPFAEDGGEEGEVAGVYFVDAGGRPRRIGMAAGNEFSDHKFEKTNYLNLAGSKLRTCSLGPEIVVEPQFDRVPGTVSIERAGRTIWSKEIATGEDEMCHSLANLEHHHFKFEAHRRPGDVHVHFFGAHSLSFGEGLVLQNDDVMVIQFEGFGRPLRNPVKIADRSDALVPVETL
jgi:hypothetical protein